MIRRIPGIMIVALAALFDPAPAQQASHAHHAAHAAAAPAEIGNSAFAALREVITLLEADPATDWSRVNLEALRQHLIDMQHVVMNAQVLQQDVGGGIRMDVTGSGATADAIRRVVLAHARQPDLLPGVTISAVEIAGGARLTATAADPHAATRVRSLGFAGLLVRGDHHGPHHLAIARGDHRHAH